MKILLEILFAGIPNPDDPKTGGPSIGIIVGIVIGTYDCCVTDNKSVSYIRFIPYYPYIILRVSITYILMKICNLYV